MDVGEVSTMTLVSRRERQNKPAKFQVFSRVDGKTLVARVREGMLVSELRAEIARRLHASPGQCCATRGGKLLSLSSSVEEAAVVKDSCVELDARGLGGSVPGEWFCNHCNRGGCWPARQRCFRCGMPREDASPGEGDKAKGKGGGPPQRETSYPERGPSQASLVRSSKPAGEGTVPVHVPPEVVTQLLNVLQGLGVSHHVLGEFARRPRRPHKMPGWFLDVLGVLRSWRKSGWKPPAIWKSSVCK